MLSPEDLGFIVGKLVFFVFVCAFFLSMIVKCLVAIVLYH